MILLPDAENRIFIRLDKTSECDGQTDRIALAITARLHCEQCGRAVKTICVCQCIHLCALSRLHFLINFHQNWCRRKNPQE